MSGTVTSTSSLQSPSTAQRGSRGKAPVFILGCGRSGTKMLYHMLLSSGNFAVYHSESNAFNLLGVKFGDLSQRANRQRMLDAWFQSKLFARTGLTPDEIAPQVLNDCHNTGEFLRLFMEAIARKQGVERWADSTPLNVLYIPLIKQMIPDALIVHILRDGRDVAVSLNKIGWIRPFRWDRERGLLAAGLFWRWMVGSGLRAAKTLGADYYEIHYEDLVQQPQEALAKLGEFIKHRFDYDRIRKVALGSLQTPNSSFRGDTAQGELNPMGRWKAVLSGREVAELEAMIGDRLVETGYQLSAPAGSAHLDVRTRLMTAIYPSYFQGKLWLKSNTPLGRRMDIERMGLQRP